MTDPTTTAENTPARPNRLLTTYYHREIERLHQFLIPKGARVLELGCGTGNLLAAVEPSYGVGIDISEEAIASARRRHGDRKQLLFRQADAETVDWKNEPPFDYVIMSDLIPLLKDVQASLANLRKVCAPNTRIALNFHSNLWRPALTLATVLGLRERIPDYNWLSTHDVENLLHLAGFEQITSGGRVVLPLYVPLLSGFLNRVVAKLPLLDLLCLTYHIVARPSPEPGARQPAPTVSILVPTRNEEGNIEATFERTNPLGSATQLVFIDGHSTDGTIKEIRRCMEKYRATWPDVLLVTQSGKGKGQAVRQGFESCTGDILMILDSDLTMPPEELPKYYEAIVSGKGDFINGCRLVYPQEQKAMRFLNMVANHIFALLFTWLLSQHIKDTLCGTKVLWRKDYNKIAANRSYFGDFDPFGDFDLLFGASKLNLKIIDLPIRYRERTYGTIKINRWRDGWLLLRMSFIALFKLKFS